MYKSHKITVRYLIKNVPYKWNIYISDIWISCEYWAADKTVRQKWKYTKGEHFYKYFFVRYLIGIPAKILNFYEVAKTYKNSKTSYFIKIQNHGGNSILIPD